MPVLLRSVSSSMISSERSVSRLPVGSSASSTSGSVTSARAMATRCCCPPESSAGVWSAHGSRPTRSSERSAASRRCFLRLAAIEQRQLDIFQRGGAGQQVEALEHEAEIAPAQQRTLVARRDPAPRCRESGRCPLVGTSRQPRMFMVVDLPEPDGPMTATKSPRSIVRSTPFSAWNAAAPWPKVLVMPSSLDQRFGSAPVRASSSGAASSLLRGPDSGDDFHARFQFVGSDHGLAAVALRQSRPRSARSVPSVLNDVNGLPAADADRCASSSPRARIAAGRTCRPPLLPRSGRSAARRWAPAWHCRCSGGDGGRGGHAGAQQPSALLTISRAS